MILLSLLPPIQWLRSNRLQYLGPYHFTSKELNQVECGWYTTKNAIIYVVDSKMVLENRLRKFCGDIFVIKSNTTTTFM